MHSIGFWCVLCVCVTVCGLFPPCWQRGVFATANKPFRGLYGWQRRIGMVTCYDRRPARSNQAVSVAVNQTQTCWLLFKHREKDKKDGWYKYICRERDTHIHTPSTYSHKALLVQHMYNAMQVHLTNSWLSLRATFPLILPEDICLR